MYKPSDMWRSIAGRKISLETTYENQLLVTPDLWDKLCTQSFLTSIFRGVILSNNWIQEVKRPPRRGEGRQALKMYMDTVYPRTAVTGKTLLSSECLVPLHPFRPRRNLSSPCTFTDKLEEDHRVTLMLKSWSLIVLSLPGEIMNEVWDGNLANFRDPFLTGDLLELGYSIPQVKSYSPMTIWEVSLTP